ncbi:MAG TPA: hypothetical protein VFV32_14435 [Acidimicrobiales bacterium]|jgi:hypothetical protein|nr:hypothetical protein [Acidimicrobiales bacterium]
MRTSADDDTPRHSLGPAGRLLAYAVVLAGALGAGAAIGAAVGPEPDVAPAATTHEHDGGFG